MEQREGETSERYIMELYRLAENCDYGALKEEIIRDRLVVGIRDAALSQQLQLDSELTLEKTKKKIRQREAVGEQQRELKGPAEELSSWKRCMCADSSSGGGQTSTAGTAKLKLRQEPHPVR